MKHKCRPITWNKIKIFHQTFNICDLFYIKHCCWKKGPALRHIHNSLNFKCSLHQKSLYNQEYTAPELNVMNM